MSRLITVSEIESEEHGSDQKRATGYQWLRGEKSITDSSEYTGTTTPLLCISNATIDMDGPQYSCRLNIDDNILRSIYNQENHTKSQLPTG